MFNQLFHSITYKEYDMRINSTGLINNIGSYKRQYPYYETCFYNFDKFLFSSWKDKESIEWGNALSNVDE